MANYDFRADLEVAKKTEKEVAILLEKIYKAKILEFGTTNEWDILAEIGGKVYSFEIKEDFIGERTGNVGLEYSCRGKLSGIETSKADFYIYKLHTRDYGIKYVQHETKTLKEKIKNVEYFTTVNGGDPGSNSLNYLFRYNSFVRDCVFLSLEEIAP